MVFNSLKIWRREWDSKYYRTYSEDFRRYGWHRKSLKALQRIFYWTFIGPAIGLASES
jgi:hypothetical protein